MILWLQIKHPSCIFCNREHRLFILRSKARSCPNIRYFPLFPFEVIMMFMELLLCAKIMRQSTGFKELRAGRGCLFQKEGIHSGNTLTPQSPGVCSVLECGKADITHKNQRLMCKTATEAGLFATLGVDLSPRAAVMGKLRTLSSGIHYFFIIVRGRVE